MKDKTTRKYGIALFIGLSITLGAEIVPACRIIIPTIRKHHSAATLAKWKAYNEAHHIAPKSPKETLQAFDWACIEMGFETVVVDTVLPMEPEPMEPELTAVDLPVAPSVPTVTLPSIPEEDTEAKLYPVLFPITYGGFAAAVPPPPLSSVPEPSTWILFASGSYLLSKGIQHGKATPEVGLSPSSRLQKEI